MESTQTNIKNSMPAVIYQPLKKRDQKNLSLLLQNLSIHSDYHEIHTPKSSAIGLYPDEAGSYSWCRPLKKHYYKLIIIDEGVKIFPNQWGDAFLKNCINALDLAGNLVVYCAKTAREIESGIVTFSWLTQRLGNPEKIIGDYAVFGFTELNQLKSATVLSWFHQSLPLIYFGFSEIRSVESHSNDAFFDTCGKIYGLSNINYATNTDGLRADFLSEDYDSLTKFLNYSIFGVGQKFYTLEKIFSEIYFEKKISVADIGSGSGLLGLELLLNSNHVESVVNYEKSPAQALISVGACAALKKTSFKNFSTQICRVDDDLFKFQRKFDVVTLLTTLCYVSRNQQFLLLKKAWESLTQGGCLIILENIKSDPSARDYQLMFDADELDQLLLNFSNTIYYRSAVSGAAMDRSFDSKKTVYRIIFKNQNGS